MCVHLSATKRHFPPQTGKTVVRQVQLSLSLMIVCTMHPCSNFYTPIILSSNGADLQHTGSSSSHLGKFSPPGKFEMRVHFWKTDPTSTHAFLNGGWPGALQMHFCLLLKPEEGFSFSHSTVRGRGTETAWRATKLCKKH